MMTRLIFLLVLPAAAAVAHPKPPPLPPGPPAPTARDVTEAQLDSHDGRPARLSGAEAQRIHERYLSSIGQTIETNRIGAGAAPR